MSGLRLRCASFAAHYAKTIFTFGVWNLAGPAAHLAELASYLTVVFQLLVVHLSDIPLAVMNLAVGMIHDLYTGGSPSNQGCT